MTFVPISDNGVVLGIEVPVANGAVLYTTAQSLTANQQAQGRTNIAIGVSSFPRAVVYISNTTHTFQRSGRYLIKAIGAGGGGGGYGGGGSVGAGGGAGGDCWSEADFTAGSTLTIVVGIGGLGGSATTATAGATGSNTTVSGTGLTTMVATGGSGGAGRANPGGVAGGTGGTASGGTIVNDLGCNGDHAFSLATGSTYPGKGAGTRWGSGGRPGTQAVTASGENGVAFGSGGGGGTEAGGTGGGGGALGAVEIYLIEGI